MSDTAKTTLNAEKPTSDPKKTTSTTTKDGLPTPNATPEVDTERVEADSARRQEENAKNEEQKQVERVLACKEDSVYEILGLQEDATQQDKEKAWKTLGCMLHKNNPKQEHNEKVEKAYQKLRGAAFKLEIDEALIGTVDEWDGKGNLDDWGTKDDSDGDESPFVRQEPSEDNGNESPSDKEKPPESISKIYEQATSLMNELKKEPNNSTIAEKIKDFNREIEENTRMHMTEREPDYWAIKLEFFQPHYDIVLNCTANLAKDPGDSESRVRLKNTLETIDQCIRINHYPVEWSVEPANSSTSQDNEEKATSDPAPAHMDYPWPTAELADGSRILGIKPQGRGRRVCVEGISEEGRLIRTIEAASKVGLREVENYASVKNHKILSEGQNQWSYKDRNDFKKLHWVTYNPTLRKNIAANTKTADNYSCVEFWTKGKQILTVSSVERVLGQVTARSEIITACERDGIPPPWEAGNISEYSDPSVKEKNPSKRRAMERAQAKQNAHANKNAQANGPAQTEASPNNNPVNMSNGEQVSDMMKKMQPFIKEMMKEMMKEMVTEMTKEILREMRK